jgi:hypothetical protein
MGVNTTYLVNLELTYPNLILLGYQMHGHMTPTGAPKPGGEESRHCDSQYFGNRRSTL